jgi:hypothetical protein
MSGCTSHLLAFFGSDSGVFSAHGVGVLGVVIQISDYILAFYRKVRKNANKNTKILLVFSHSDCEIIVEWK